MLMSVVKRIEKRGKSRTKMQEARRYSPGGVHSSIRKELPYPMIFERAEGAYVWDVDGNRYIDYNAAFAATILGYAHPRVDQAVFESSHKLNLVGLGSNEYEIALAKKIIDNPVTQITFYSSCKFLCESSALPGTDRSNHRQCKKQHQ